MMEPEQQMRNLRDFLLVYNRMTEICFQRCSSNFNYRTLTMDEDRCVDNCAGKLIRANHRLMGTYVNLMPKMMQRRMDEMQSKTAEAEAAAAAASAATAGSVTEAPPSIETSLPPTTSYLPVTDTGTANLQALPEPGQPLGVPALLDPSPAFLDTSPAFLTQPPQINTVASVPLAPLPETVTPTRVDNLVIGPPSTVLSPLPGPSVGSVYEAPLPVVQSTAPPVVPALSVPTLARPPESLVTDVSPASKA